MRLPGSVICGLLRCRVWLFKKGGTREGRTDLRRCIAMIEAVPLSLTLACGERAGDWISLAGVGALVSRFSSVAVE